MNIDLCEPKKVWPLLLGGVLFSIWEWWLGKTSKTRANSTLDLALMVLAAALTLIVSLKGRKDGSARTSSSRTEDGNKGA